MSRTIENRVVEMQFQNKQFEEAVAQSRQSIQLLEKDIKLLEGVQALKNLDAKVQSIDFSAISNGVQALTDRFSTLGIVSMSVVNTITSAITGTVLSTLNKITSSFSGLFNLIYQKGLSRANNLEQARFSMTGLLKDTNKVNQVMEIVNKSVDGTAYGLDEAARAASTLVATYGASSAGLNSVEGALHAIVGVAAQTNRSFEDVSHIFSTVAGNGRVMSMQLNQLAGYGLNAAAALAEYLNEDTKASKALRQKFKLGKSVTEKEVRDLVTKGKITSDIFNAAFEKFFENAEKANDTLDGAISNVKSALGRIGAEFISPIITEKSPLVKFFNALRVAINNVKKALVDFEIPKNVTDVINKFIDVAGTFIQWIGKIDVNKFEVLGKISDAIRSFGMSLAGSFETILTALSPSTGLYISFDDIYKKRIEELRSTSDYVNKSYKDTIKDILNEHDNIERILYKTFMVNRDKHSDYDYYFNKLVNTITNDNLLGIETKDPFIDVQNHLKILTSSEKEAHDAFRDLVNEVTGFTVKDSIIDILWGNDSKKDKEKSLKEITNMSFDEFNQKLYNKTLDQFNNMTFGGMTVNQIKEEARRRQDAYKEYYDSIPAMAEKYANDWINTINKLNPFRQDIYQDLITIFTLITDGLTKIHEIAMDSLKDVLGEENVGVLSYLFGKDADPRNLKEIINNIMNWIIDKVTKVKLAIYNNSEGIGDVFRGIFAVIDMVVKVFGALWTITKNAIKSFAPLFGKIFNLISAMFGTFADMEKELTLDVFVEKVSLAIDWLAKALEWVWDNLIEFFNLLSPEQAKDTVLKMYDILVMVGNYLATNWPKWVEKATPYLEEFYDVILGVADVLKVQLGEALEYIKPYFNEFTDWLYEATGGLIDLREPADSFNSVLETTSDIVSNANEAISGFSSLEGVGGLGQIGDAINGLPKADLLVDLGAGLEKIGNAAKDMKDNDIKYLIPRIFPEDSTEEKTGLDVFMGWAKTIFTFLTTSYKNLKGAAEKIGSWIKSSQLYKDLKEKIDDIKGFLSKIDIDAVLDVVQRIVGIISGGALGIGGGKALFGAGTLMQKLPKSMTKITQSITGTIKAFSPLAQIDNKTTRINARSEKWKSIALTFAAIGAMMLMFAASMKIIESINPDSFTRVMTTFGVILGGVLVVVIALCVVLGIMQSKDTSVTQKFLGNTKIPIIGNIEQGSLSTKGTSLYKTLGAAAAIIASIGVSMILISAAMKILSTIKEEDFDRTIELFIYVAGSLIILVALVGALAVLLQQRSSGTKKSFTGPGDWKILGAFAAIIFTIGHAMFEIMAALAILASLPLDNISLALDVFVVVAGSLAVIMLLIGVIAVILNNEDAGRGFIVKGGSQAKNGGFGVLVGMAVVIFAIAEAIKGIMESLALIAYLPLTNVDKALEVFLWVATAMGILVFVIGLMATVMSSSEIGAEWPKLLVSLVAIAVIIGVLGAILPEMMLAIAGFAALISASGISSEAITMALVTLVAIVVAFGIFLMSIAGASVVISQVGGTKALIALGLISVLLGAIALVALGIGQMIKMMGESGLDGESIENILVIFTTLVLGVLVICTVLAAVVGTQAEVLIAVALIALVLGVLALLAYAIGNMVIDISNGISKMEDTLERFFNFFALMDSKDVVKARRNLVNFMNYFGKAMIDAFVDITQYIKANKQLILDGIVTIFAIIFDAMSLQLDVCFQVLLDKLTLHLHMISDWLDANIFVILNILDKILVIVNLFLYGGSYEGYTFTSGGLIGLLLTGVDYLIGGLINIIENRGPELIDAVVVLITDIIDGIVNILDPNSSDETALKLRTALSNFADTFALVLTNVFGLDNDSDEGKKLYTVSKNIVGSLFLPGAWKITEEDQEVIDDFLADLGRRLCLGFKEMFLGMNSFFFIAGTNPIVYYLMKGFKKELVKMRNNGSVLAAAILDGFDEEFQINSPSRKMYDRAGYIVQGLTNGLKDNMSKVSISTKRLVEKINDPFESVGNDLKFIFSTAVNDIAQSMGIEGFTITPDMDLTKITEGFGDIQSMMDGNSSFNISALSGNMTDSMSASDTAEGFDTANTPEPSFLDNVDPETIINFTQNNYSPEQLSRIDIYRDTKNLLNNPAAISTVLSALR